LVGASSALAQAATYPAHGPVPCCSVAGR